jgi:hypothetical protein
MKSEWQKRIEGEWHGIPSVFDAAGNHMGHISVRRASVTDGSRTTYTMDTRLNVTGPLRARFEARDFAFGVADGDRDRVYLGPDFIGAGHPFGQVVDAHYYSPAWQADLRTLVHILPDGKMQAYSSQLFEGPTLIAVFNGLYALSGDEGFLEAERSRGATSHVLPFKQAGKWSGALSVHDGEAQPLGQVQAILSYRPLTLLRAQVEVHLQGALERRWRYERARQGNRHVFDGPDLWGNAIGYGRALYTSQHVHGVSEKLRGREFLLDDDYTLSVVWQLSRSDRVTHVLYGCLRWQAGETVLAAHY